MRLHTHMTVLFLILYCACIWSILGTAPCRVSFVVFKHLRGVKNAGLRARGTRESEREHAEHVQDSKARDAYGRNGDATDIAGET